MLKLVNPDITIGLTIPQEEEFQERVAIIEADGVDRGTAELMAAELLRKRVWLDHHRRYPAQFPKEREPTWRFWT